MSWQLRKPAENSENICEGKALNIYYSRECKAIFHSTNELTLPDFLTSYLSNFFVPNGVNIAEKERQLMSDNRELKNHSSISRQAGTHDSWFQLAKQQQQNNNNNKK